MPILLASLGTSWAVVPEAFYLLPPGPEGFTAVHVLTTSSREIEPGVAEVRRYFTRHPGVTLTVTRVEGFTDLRSEEDHFLFEEVLYRWILAHAPIPAARFVCLAGGFKTMSAAMQKAAAVFGATEVFHVLADRIFGSDKAGEKREARTAAEIDHALASGAIRYVRLGTESGWPQLHAASAIDYPLESVPVDDPVTTARAPDFALRARVREMVERGHRIAEAWERLPDLPFVELATWPKAELAWLHEPLDPTTDSIWVRALPKIELHCHLGGFATHGNDLAAVRAAAKIPSNLPSLQDCAPPAGWPRPTAPIGLDRYMRLGDNSGSKLLRDPGCLRRQCELLYDRLFADRIAYAEIRCSPNNYADPARGRSAFEVLREIRETFQHCMQLARTSAARFPCQVNLLIIATRKNAGDRSDISRHLALAITAADLWRDHDSCRVVGVDLAGFESIATRAAIFQTDFEAVHRVGLAVTVHAGENDDAEGIWQAVFKLNARRLGHALHLGQSPDLLRAVAERGIGVEMCPFANLQIKGFAPFHSRTVHDHQGPAYPLLDYLRSGVRVTANTDNSGISTATLSENLLLLAELCPGLTRLDILRLQDHALATAFVPPILRYQLRGVIARMLPRP